MTVTQASALNQCTLVVVSTLLAYNIDFPTGSSGSLNLWISVRLTLEPPRVLASSMGKRSLVQCVTCLPRYPLSGFESTIIYLMDVQMLGCRVQRFNDSLKQVFTVVSLKAWASFEASPDVQNLGSGHRGRNRHTRFSATSSPVVHMQPAETQAIDAGRAVPAYDSNHTTELPYAYFGLFRSYNRFEKPCPCHCGMGLS